jgi:small GTP-binding protein
VATIGLINFFTSYKLSDGSLANVHLLDTAGQEVYRSLSEQYYKKADCCLLVYSISDRRSFDECKNYYFPNILEKCRDNIKVIVLGNKTDLEGQRQVPSKEGSDFASENGFLFMETSCLKNENVADAFESLIEIANRESIRSRNSNFGLGETETNQKKSCSC